MSTIFIMATEIIVYTVPASRKLLLDVEEDDKCDDFDVNDDNHERVVKLLERYWF